MPEPAATASYPSLANRTVLITGGATGIGAALVAAFARQRSTVCFIDIDDAAAERLCTELQLPPETYRRCDLRDIAALRATVAAVREGSGAIEVLINNAANDERHAIDAVEPDDFDERIALNLRHYWFAIQAVRPGMAASGGGSIINVGSIAWRLGFPDVPVYATAKAGVAGMTKVLATELGPERIRVNCIEPGFVATERQRRLWLTPELEARVREGQCLPDLIEPDAIASMALFLAADDSAHCTSQTFTVDGGWT